MNRELSEVLNQEAGVSDEDLEEVRNIQSEKGGSIGEILIRKKIITEEQLLEALGILYDMEYWQTLPLENLGSEIIHSVPIQFLKKYSMVPLEIKSNGEGSPHNFGLISLQTENLFLTCLSRTPPPSGSSKRRSNEWVLVGLSGFEWV